MYPGISFDSILGADAVGRTKGILSVHVHIKNSLIYLVTRNRGVFRSKWRLTTKQARISYANEGVAFFPGWSRIKVWHIWLVVPDFPFWGSLLFRFGILGGCKFPALGAFSEYLKVERNQVLEVPSHLEIHHAAAWPLAGLTAWRSVMIIYITLRQVLIIN